MASSTINSNSLLFILYFLDESTTNENENIVDLACKMNKELVSILLFQDKENEGNEYYEYLIYCLENRKSSSSSKFNEIKQKKCQLIFLNKERIKEIISKLASLTTSPTRKQTNENSPLNILFIMNLSIINHFNEKILKEIIYLNTLLKARKEKHDSTEMQVNTSFIINLYKNTLNHYTSKVFNGIFSSESSTGSIYILKDLNLVEAEKMKMVSDSTLKTIFSKEFRENSNSNMSNIKSNIRNTITNINSSTLDINLIEDDDEIEELVASNNHVSVSNDSLLFSSPTKIILSTMSTISKKSNKKSNKSNKSNNKKKETQVKGETTININTSLFNINEIEDISENISSNQSKSNSKNNKEEKISTHITKKSNKLISSTTKSKKSKNCLYTPKKNKNEGSSTSNKSKEKTFSIRKHTQSPFSKKSKEESKNKMVIDSGMSQSSIETINLNNEYENEKNESLASSRRRKKIKEGKEAKESSLSKVINSTSKNPVRAKTEGERFGKILNEEDSVEVKAAEIKTITNLPDFQLESNEVNSLNITSSAFLNKKRELQKEDVIKPINSYSSLNINISHDRVKQQSSLKSNNSSNSKATFKEKNSIKINDLLNSNRNIHINNINLVQNKYYGTHNAITTNKVNSKNSITLNESNEFSNFNDKNPELLKSPTLETKKFERYSIPNFSPSSTKNQVEEDSSEVSIPTNIKNNKKSSIFNPAYPERVDLVSQITTKNQKEEEKKKKKKKMNKHDFPKFLLRNELHSPSSSDGDEKISKAGLAVEENNPTEPLSNKEKNNENSKIISNLSNLNNPNTVNLIENNKKEESSYYSTKISNNIKNKKKKQVKSKIIGINLSSKEKEKDSATKLVKSKSNNSTIEKLNKKYNTIGGNQRNERNDSEEYNLLNYSNSNMNKDNKEKRKEKKSKQASFNYYFFKDTINKTSNNSHKTKKTSTENSSIIKNTISFNFGNSNEEIEKNSSKISNICNNKYSEIEEKEEALIQKCKKLIQKSRMNFKYFKKDSLEENYSYNNVIEESK